MTLAFRISSMHNKNPAVSVLTSQDEKKKKKKQLQKQVCTLVLEKEMMQH
jgi:hypothetical protein